MNARRVMAVGIVGVGLLAPVVGHGDGLPANAKAPVQILDGKGEFARKLQGTAMPSGRGWRAVTDAEKRFQIMVPDRWKVDPDPTGDVLLRFAAPGSGKDPAGVLIALLTQPRSADPLEVDQPFALSYADDLASVPELARAQFRATDSGLVLARGMKFALAGGTMVGPKKAVYQQEQLVYISEDRVVTLQFTARQEEFAKVADDVAKVFASYQTLAVRKLEDE